MTHTADYLLLAQGDGCSAVAVAFVVITIIGWIMQLISGAKPGQPQRGGARPIRPARQRDERLQQEIDLFLEQVDGKRRATERPKPAQGRPPQQAPVLEVVPEDRPRRPHRPSTIRSRTEQATAVPQAAPPAAPQPAAQRQLAERRKAPAPGLSQRREAELPRRVFAEGQAVELTAAENQGTFAGRGGGEGTGGASGTVHPIVSMLRTPQGMRQAIMLREVLDRPLSRRATRLHG